MKVFQRRIGRSEYWLLTAALVAVAVLLQVMGLNQSGSALLFVWLLIWTWRLHDFGKPGWYNLIPIGAMIAVTVIGVVVLFNDKEFSDAFAVVMGADDRALTDRGLYLVIGFLLVLLATQISYMVWLGLKRGDADDNAYGPPRRLFAKG
jgi:uncharacterized membrane protein YhaH (DUF805 family)